MKIAQFNISDYAGGSSRAAYRHHRGLLLCGEDSTLVVREKLLHDPTVVALRLPGHSGLRQRCGGAWNRWRAFRRLKLLAGTRSFFTWEDEAPFEPRHLATLPPADVVHLHWINRFLRAETCVPFLATQTPLVWTLHDANLVHGGWHYEPDPAEITPALRAEDRILAERKSAMLDRLPAGRLALVCPSHWLADQVRRHPAAARHRIEVIAYGIETDFFHPGDPQVARAALGLPLDRPVLGFVAHTLGYERKGFDVLLAACNSLPPDRRPLVLCAGHGHVDHPDVVTIGSQQSDRILRLLYQASDLFVCPSRHDNLPNTVLEALACGVPVVASDAGGISDAVIDGVVGRLTPTGSAPALREAIESLLMDRTALARTGAAARERAITRFDQRRQAGRYLDLYRELRGERPASPQDRP